MRADQSGACLDRASTDADCVAADIFSSTIREYSAGEHVPRAIINVRRPTVSHEENANSVIIPASDAGLLRLRLLIAGRWEYVGEEQAHPRASANPDARSTLLIALRHMHEECGVAYSTQYIQPVKITVPRF
jgi:hypothetical protein